MAELALKLNQTQEPADPDLKHGYPTLNRARYQGLMMQLEGNTPAGQEHFRQAVASYLEAGHTYRLDPDTTSEFLLLFVEALESGLPLSSDYDRALERAQTLLKFEPTPWPGIRCEVGRGLRFCDQGDKAKAVKHLEKGLKDLEEVLSRLGAGQAAALRLRERYRKAFETLARLQLEGGQPQHAFETLARLQQVETVARLRSEPVRPQNPSLRLQSEEVEAQRQRLEGMEQTSRLHRAVNCELLARTRAEYVQCVRELEQQDPDCARLAVRPVNFARLQSLLPPRTVLIQLFPSKEALYLFVVTRADLKVRRLAVTRPELEKQVRNLRALLNQRDGAYKAPLAELSRWLTPLQEDMGPTDNLLDLPFTCLRQGSQFLVENHPVVTLATAAELESLGSAAHIMPAGLMAMGNPDGTLPGAEAEVRDLTKIFPQTRVFTGRKATKERILELDGQILGCLHLATHGQLNSRNPLQSSLLVAGGHLSMGEIAGLRLDRVNLVTLSACQTALADSDLALGQDLYSLSEGFGLAGVRSVMGTLWSVDDGATRTLMGQFYQQLKQGKGRAEALRLAQVSLLHQPQTAHPVYWGAFTLMGDWR